MLSEDQKKKTPKVRSRKQVALITGTNPDLSDIVDEKDQKGRYEIWVPNCSLSKKQSSYHQFRTSLLICHFPRFRKKNVSPQWIHIYDMIFIVMRCVQRGTDPLQSAADS